MVLKHMAWLDLGIGLSAIAVLQFLLILWVKARLQDSIKHEYDKKLAEFNQQQTIALEKLRLDQAKEIEATKNALQFEMLKRRRVYEGKLENYKKYFALLDTYSHEAREASLGNFAKNVSEIFSNPTEDALKRYLTNTMQMLSEQSNKAIMLRHEINGLRLEAGAKLLELLDEYAELYDQLQRHTNQYMVKVNNTMQEMSRDISLFDPIRMEKLLKESLEKEQSAVGDKLREVQAQIFQEMRHELEIT